jgi:cystathionine gamma-synthase
MSGFGGVVSFQIRGNLESASKFIDALRIPYIAPSLGGTESLVEQPTVISYWDQSAEERARLGIEDNLIRYACGIEDAEDLLADIEQALDRL